MNSKHKPTIGIIGGGLAGLSVAYLIAKRNIKIIVFEKESQSGGQLSAFSIGDTYLEYFYHHIFHQDKAILELLKELKLDKNLLWLPSKVGYLNDEGLFSLSKAFDLFKFKPLSPLNKIKFGWGLFRTGYLNPSENSSDVSAATWLKKQFGKRGYQKVWEPLLESKFGKYKDRASSAWVREKIAHRGRSRSTPFSSELLGYLDGSFYLMVRKLNREIQKMKGKIFLETKVSGVKVKNNKWQVTTKKDEFEVDVLVSTIASPSFNKIISDDLPPLPEPLYLSVKCLIVILENKLNPFYWLNLDLEELPFGLLVEQTNLVSPKKYEGKHIIYLSKYLPCDLVGEIGFTKREQTEWLTSLFKIFSHLNKKSVIETKASFDRYAALVFKNSFKRNSYKRDIKNLYILNNEKCYPYDRSMNSIIYLARHLVKEIEKEL